MNRRPINRFIFIAIALSIFCFPAIAQDLNEENDLDMNSPFGVLEFLHWNHPWNNYKYPGKKELEKSVSLMKEAGVGWVRMDFLWSDIEPEQGRFEFEKYDYIVELLSKNNINILGLLGYSTDWASSCAKWNCPPKDNALFVNYAVKVVSRYKEKVKYWEIWNEPDSSVYWTLQDNLKAYCALLKDVYLALKKVDPECKILHGGLAGELAGVNKLYDAGAKDYFDILNIHIFDSPLNPTSVKRITAFPRLAYKVMARNGDGNKKIWITEIGCPGVKKGLKVNNWWIGNNPDEKQQAEWLEKVYTQLLQDKNAEKIFWSFLRDCNKHWDNGIDYFGLVRWDFTRKPAFKSYKKCFQDWKKSK